MTRGVVSDTANKLATKRFNIVNLVDFAVGSGNYGCDGPANVSFDGKTFLAVGGALSISEITEEDNLTIEEVTINISALDTAAVKLFVDNDYIDREVIIYRAVCDDNYQIVGTPIEAFRGRLDQPIIQEDFEGGTATIQIKASSHWADFEKSNGRRTNDSEQQSHYAGDTFFEKAAEVNKDVKWGRA